MKAKYQVGDTVYINNDVIGVGGKTAEIKAILNDRKDYYYSLMIDGHTGIYLYHESALESFKNFDGLEELL